MELQRGALHARGWPPAGVGLVLCLLGGMSLAQVGGGDSEFFTTIGFFLGSAGLLGIVIGGVAIGIQLARE